MSIQATTKKMLMGDIDIGQYIFKSTDTMLPKKHSNCMDALLKLYSFGIVPIDVASGSKRCMISFLVPRSELKKWVPNDTYIIQTYNSESVEVLSTTHLNDEKWEISTARTHVLNEYPKRHLGRIARIATSESECFSIWETMCLVSIWEKDESDDLDNMIRYCEYLMS